MFVPIIIDPCEFYDYRYLWEYLKYLYHCSKNNWPIIAASEYAVYRDKRPDSNAYEKEFCSLHQYELLTKEQEDKVRKFFLPESILLKLSMKKGSKLGAKIFLLKHRYLPLERELHKIILKIKETFPEPIEGFITWGSHFKSIAHLSISYHVPVITNEFCIRFPEYYPLSYFCVKELYSDQEIKKAYATFMKEKKQIPYFLLTRKEILGLFLSRERLHMIEKDVIPEYEIGIAGCHPIIATFLAKSMYTDLELIQDVRNEYAEKDILFRRHPGDEPYQAGYTLTNRDSSEYASDFLMKCGRITAHGSNTLVEAMLWGKPVYSHDISPFTFLCCNDLHKKMELPINDETLNFIIFTYLVPYNKIWDEDYIRWRLRERRGDIIYQKNIEYYFQERKIPVGLLKSLPDIRLKHIILHRKEFGDDK